MVKNPKAKGIEIYAIRAMIDMSGTTFYRFDRHESVAIIFRLNFELPLKLIGKKNYVSHIF